MPGSSTWPSSGRTSSRRGADEGARRHRCAAARRRGARRRPPAASARGVTRAPTAEHGGAHARARRDPRAVRREPPAAAGRGPSGESSTRRAASSSECPAAPAGRCRASRPDSGRASRTATTAPSEWPANRAGSARSRAASSRDDRRRTARGSAAREAPAEPPWPGRSGTTTRWRRRARARPRPSSPPRRRGRGRGRAVPAPADEVAQSTPDASRAVPRTPRAGGCRRHRGRVFSSRMNALRGGGPADSRQRNTNEFRSSPSGDPAGGLFRSHREVEIRWRTT